MRKQRRSSLEAFDGCPYRYDVLYNTCAQCGDKFAEHAGMGERDGYRESGPPNGGGEPAHDFQPVRDHSDPAWRGIVFHEAAFIYIVKLAEQHLTSDFEESRLALREAIARIKPPTQVLTETNQIYTRWAEWFELDLLAYLAAEEHQESDQFTWRPDLVYVKPMEIEIIDWKSYYRGFTEAQAREEFQLKFYLWEAMRLWPNFPVYRFTFNFVRLGYGVSIALTPEEIEAFEPEVSGIRDAILSSEETEEWPAMAGSHCTLCRLECPLVDNKYMLPSRLTTKAEAETAFSRVIVLENELRALRKALSGWCNDEGALNVGGQEYAHRPKTTRRYPAERAIEFFKERGHITSSITISKSNLGPLAKLKDPAVEQFLEEHEQREVGWDFRHKKAGELFEKAQTD